MKLIQLALLALLLASCNSSYFNTANNMQNMYGTVYLQNGKELTGNISVSLNNSFGPRDFIRFSARGRGDREKIYIEDLNGFAIRNDFYAPKKLDRGFLSGDRMLFVKRLTKEDSRIHLYEYFDRRNTANTNGNSFSVPVYEYFIALPGQEKYTAWNLDGRRLVPNFEDKMSEYVKDCPALAEKIKRKDRGYFYAQVSLSNMKRIETVLNIIDEYNTCR
jgi:hypothetical protein